MEKVPDTYEEIRQFYEVFSTCIDGLKANNGWTACQTVTGLLLTGSSEDKWTVFVAGSDKPPDVMLTQREDGYSQGDFHYFLQSTYQQLSQLQFFGE